MAGRPGVLTPVPSDRRRAPAHIVRPPVSGSAHRAQGAGTLACDHAARRTAQRRACLLKPTPDLYPARWGTRGRGACLHLACILHRQRCGASLAPESHQQPHARRGAMGEPVAHGLLRDTFHGPSRCAQPASCDSSRRGRSSKTCGARETDNFNKRIQVCVPALQPAAGEDNGPTPAAQQHQHHLVAKLSLEFFGKRRAIAATPYGQHVLARGSGAWEYGGS